MLFEMSEEIIAIQDMARKFAQNEILPRVADDEKNHRFQRDLVTKMGELGFFGCPIPEAYGGSDLGFLAHAVVTEEISKVSGSIRAGFNMQTMGTAREIFQFGTEEQKKHYIPKLVSTEYLGWEHRQRVSFRGGGCDHRSAGHGDQPRPPILC